MAMRKAFTGGACAPGGEAQAMGNNAFTNMFEHMIEGTASAQQKAEGYGPQANIANYSAMEAAFDEQQKHDEMAAHFESMQLNTPQMYHPQPMHHANNVEASLSDLWDQPDMMLNEKARSVGMPHQYSHGPMFPPNFSSGPMFMPPMPMHHMHARAPEVSKIEEIEEVKDSAQAETDDSNEIAEVAGKIADNIASLNEEKYNKSEFLSFAKKLSQGAFKINDGRLLEVPEKLAEYDTAEAKAAQNKPFDIQSDRFVGQPQDTGKFFKEEDALAGKEMQQKFDEEMQNEFNEMGDIFRDIWDGGEISDDQLQSMMAGWKRQAELSEDYYSETMKEQPIETVITVPREDLFKFDENNPYIEHDDAYALAVRLNEELKVQDAILALQANVQKNPDHAPSWRLLGQLYQENDQDDRAIAYYQKAYDLDPYDLESLLLLGVACTNELQEHVALNHLLSWLKYNPEYCDLSFPDVAPTDVNQLRAALHELFLSAISKNPNDVNVMICLGVIEFGEPNYLKAAEYFGDAIKENPTDYNLWNRYGAALANGHSIDHALEMYGQALELRPNLVRTWVNIGIAYCNRDKYEIAINKFLNALALNPEADHVWKYLHSCFWAMKNFDKCEMTKKKNVELFRGEYDIIEPNMLPKPSMEKLFEHPHLTS